MKYEIEKVQLDDFLRRYNDGEFPSQRVGQAFYQFFRIDRMNLAPDIDASIYEATKMGVIYQYFLFR